MLKRILAFILFFAMLILTGCSLFPDPKEEVAKRLALVQSATNVGEVLQYIANPVEYEFTIETVGMPDNHEKRNYTHMQLANSGFLRLTAQKTQPIITQYSNSTHTRQSYSYTDSRYVWSGIYETWWTPGKNPMLYRVVTYKNNF